MGHLSDRFDVLYDITTIAGKIEGQDEMRRLVEYFFFAGAAEMIDGIRIAADAGRSVDELIDARSREVLKVLFEKYKDGVPD